ncbi:MAG: hypothetical protein KA035_02335 [Candidatus Levybacteria bacterium]|nr:hypothetical protein [Candidatus Levybacteria bacterium]
MDNSQNNTPPSTQLTPTIRPSKTFGDIKTEKNKNPNVLDVEIRSPDKMVFKGEAQAISSRNEVGPFDVLPQHENFISIISGKITVWTGKHQKQEIESESAIMKAKSNIVRVFLGVESLNKEEKIPENPGLKKPLLPKTDEKTNPAEK